MGLRILIALVIVALIVVSLFMAVPSTEIETASFQGAYIGW